MTYTRTLLIAWLLATLGCCTLAYDMAHAGQWSLDLKGALVVPMRTTPNGTHYQDQLPHNTRLLTGGYGIGLNYALKDSPLSIQAHFLDLGSSRIKGRAVSDERYDFKAGRCTAQCMDTYGFRATDSLRGGDLTVTYTFQREGVQPFVKGGVAILQHRAVFRNEDGNEDIFTGLLPELELGAGLSYKWAYVELDWFQAVNIGGQNLPISTQQIAMFAGVKVWLW